MHGQRSRVLPMLKLALIVLLFSSVAGAIGFSGVVPRLARFFRILFGTSLALFATLLGLGLLTGEALF